ncbi:MAG: thioredoxin [Candidatus Methanoliparum thermophilum]|uniref:Thioredoxin n=1 Tax=Methanoliparum thermophilum TaxID=2491083 RepID=A0A520KRV2_METT2|nr:thioredoxin [Candidatus Methanoliparum sp. LAM-1]RZN64521.1 MAG: thioredoxin [Candidatus Methanoliparum thermophilum]BDC35883.1 thioredoxin [Candidatus Methanoliparum sp. LAM-1]
MNIFKKKDTSSDRVYKSIKDFKEGEYPHEPLLVTDETINETISRFPLVVVDCWAEWCGPCRRIAPIIDDLAKEMAGKIVFGKLNVDENRSSSVKYRITAIPTLLIFKDGKFVDQIIGAMPKKALENKLKGYVG